MYKAKLILCCIYYIPNIFIWNTNYLGLCHVRFKYWLNLNWHILLWTVKFFVQLQLSLFEDLAKFLTVLKIIFYTPRNMTWTKEGCLVFRLINNGQICTEQVHPNNNLLKMHFNSFVSLIFGHSIFTHSLFTRVSGLFQIHRKNSLPKFEVTRHTSSSTFDPLGWPIVKAGSDNDIHKYCLYTSVPTLNCSKNTQVYHG